MYTFVKTLLIIAISLVGLMLSYVAASKYSQSKIDTFCNSIGPETRMQDLGTLASRAGVDVHGPMEFQDASGPHLYAIVWDGFTMGDYACSVRGEVATGKITTKHLGF